MDLVEHILSSQCELGEGPLWHTEEQALYWLDINRKQVQRYEPSTQQHRILQLHTAITALGRRARGGFVCSTTKGFALWDRETGDLKQISLLESERPHNRFNDGGVDRQGRFWAGSMYEGPETVQPADGCLYRLDADLSVRTMETGILVSNGIGWSPDSKTMYYTDSLRNTIYAYDFDPASGEMDNRRAFIFTPDEAGVPDGLTVDSHGFIWSARWGGWKIQRYDPDGRFERAIQMPVEYPTSCVFGGAGLSDLYITSAWKEIGAAQRASHPLAGDLFRVHTGVQGLAAPLFKG